MKLRIFMKNIGEHTCMETLDKFAIISVILLFLGYITMIVGMAIMQNAIDTYVDYQHYSWWYIEQTPQFVLGNNIAMIGLMIFMTALPVIIFGATLDFIKRHYKRRNFSC